MNQSSPYITCVYVYPPTKILNLSYLTSYSAPTEIEWRYTEDSQRVRVSVRTGRIVPLPSSCNDYYEDYTQISSYKGKFS